MTAHEGLRTPATLEWVNLESMPNKERAQQALLVKRKWYIQDNSQPDSNSRAAWGHLWDSNFIPVQSPGCSCWTDVVLGHQDNDHLAEWAHCLSSPPAVARVGQGGRYNGLCQFSNNGLGKQVWMSAGGNWSKGRVTGTKWTHCLQGSGSKETTLAPEEVTS